MEQQSSDLPLTEVSFFILLSLIEPRHGYAIMKDVDALSDGRITLSTGTLYGALKRLMEQGWIERLETSSDDDSGRGKKTYRLTGQGRAILDAEVARLRSVVNAAARRVGWAQQ
ncbi:MAG TPA: PadR family transcriptional regulator [Anaerolineaceae bacterium]|nr:PadR family transcriptional regulator [Anaerolineaceae bacterium]